MTSSLPPAEIVVKNARTFAHDLFERVFWTFIGAAAAVATAAVPADMLSLTFWEGVGTAGMAAVFTFLKGLAARWVGDKHSASTAPGV